MLGIQWDCTRRVRRADHLATPFGGWHGQAYSLARALWCSLSRLQMQAESLHYKIRTGNGVPLPMPPNHFCLNCAEVLRKSSSGHLFSRRNMRSVHVIFGLVLLCAFSRPVKAADDGVYQIGVAKIDITPTVP